MKVIPYTVDFVSIINENHPKGNSILEALSLVGDNLESVLADIITPSLNKYLEEMNEGWTHAKTMTLDGYMKETENNLREVSNL